MDPIKAVVSQLVKRATVERIVPTVMSLKLFLEKKKSSLLKPLMYYLRELLRDYRNEIDQILAGDRQVIAEIEFDLRRFEAAEERRKNKKRRSEQVLPGAQPTIDEAEKEVCAIAAPIEVGVENPNPASPPQPVAEEPENVPMTPRQEEFVEGEGDETLVAPTTTVAAERESVVGTPRQVSSPLTKTTVLNSARRSATAARKTPSNVVVRTSCFDGGVEELSVTGLPARAISTPARASRYMSNVTFQFGNETTTALSPIRQNEEVQSQPS